MIPRSLGLPSLTVRWCSTTVVSDYALLNIVPVLHEVGGVISKDILVRGFQNPRLESHQTRTRPEPEMQCLPILPLRGTQTWAAPRDSDVVRTVRVRRDPNLLFRQPSVPRREWRRVYQLVRHTKLPSLHGAIHRVSGRINVYPRDDYIISRYPDSKSLSTIEILFSWRGSTAHSSE